MDERYYVHAVGAHFSKHTIVIRLKRKPTNLATFHLVPQDWPDPQSHADAARYYIRLMMAQRHEGYVGEKYWSAPDATGRVYDTSYPEAGLAEYAARLRAEHG